MYVQQLRIKDLALQRWQGEETPVVAPLFQASLVFLFIYLINVIATIGNYHNIIIYSEVPNTRADRNKRAGLEKSATLLAYLLSKLINEQGSIFRLLHEK